LPQNIRLPDQESKNYRASILVLNSPKNEARARRSSCAPPSPFSLLISLPGSLLILRAQFLRASVAALILRVVGVGFYFQDLFGVAFAVRRDQ
jgi:hypothetical protein